MKSKKLLELLWEYVHISNTLAETNNDLLKEIKEKIQMASEKMLNLEREVSETRDVIDSAILVIQGIRDQVAELLAALALNAEDQAKADELIAALDAEQVKLATAIANVPEEPPVEPPVEP